MSGDRERRARVEQFAGFAERYDDCRPRPPDELIRLLTEVSRRPRPTLVVDLGCGTGLSTRIWAGHSDRVIGIEPGDAMRGVAERRTTAPSIEYRPGTGEATGLPDGAADIVTVSQAFHWMEPGSALAEAARILRPGGVFATVDCRWPVTVDWEAEKAELELMRRIREIGEARKDSGLQVRGHPKSGHLGRIRDCGRFRYAKEVVMHHREEGDAERYIGLSMSQGHVQNVLRAGVSEEEIGLPAFRAEVRRVLGAGRWPWHVSYDIRYAIR